jgi:hypothetical protein
VTYPFCWFRRAVYWRALLAASLFLPFSSCHQPADTRPKPASETAAAEVASQGPAYTYQELQKFLPVDTIAGFRADGLPSGANFRESPTESYAICEQRYAQQSNALTISLTDCRDDSLRFASVYARTAKRFSHEDLQQRVQTTDFDIPGVKALLFYEKPSRTSRLTATVKGRYIIVVTAFPQPDTELVERVFFSLDLERLTAR